MQATRLEFSGVHGVTLQAESYGNPNHPPVILAHGGGQTRHSWGDTACALAEHGWYAVAYDHRGHGESDWSEEGLYDLAHFAQDMARIARSFNQPPVIVGASLGGLAALLGAGEIQQTLFRAIVLVDVTPSPNLAGVQRIFEFMNEHIEHGFASLDEAAESVARYTGRPRRKDSSGLRKNLRELNGRFYWHWDPRFFSDSEDGPHNPTRIIAAARNISLPVLLIRGGASDVVTKAEVAEFLEVIPHATFVDVEKARHMVAGDSNDSFTAAVLGFLEKLRN